MQLIDLSLLFISSLLGLYLAIYVAWRRRAPGSQALSILILGASFWSLGYALEIVATTIRFKLFWEKFEFFGIVIIPLAWLTFVSEYLGRPAWMRRILRHQYLLMIIPVITLILVWTNEFHNLMWQVVQMENIGPLVMLEFTPGIWFWVFAVYSYSLLLLGSIKLAVSLFSIVRLQRWQTLLALLAITLPWVGNILYITGLSPEFFLDWMAFIFLLSGVLFSISLFRFHLVNIMPIARETIFAGLTDCVLVLDLNNSIVDINLSAKQMANCTTGEAIGKNISLVMPELVTHIQQAGYEKEYSAEITHGEGEDQQFYDLHISLLTDPYTIPIGRVLVLHKITQHKRDQAELEQARDKLEAVVSQRTEELRQAFTRLQQELLQRSLAEKRFEDVVESAPDAMFLLDQKGKILLINTMAERMFGFKRQELIGINIMENLIPAEHRARQQKYFNNFLKAPGATRSSFGVDLFASRKDGKIFPIEVDVSRLEVSNGYWLAVNVHDITDRRKAEAALRESEQTYRALFENASDAIFLTDLEGRIIQGNQKVTQMLGFSLDELKAFNIFDITVAEEADDIKLKMGTLLRGEPLAPYKRRYLKRNGDILPTENYKVLVSDAEGKPKYFQNITRDISERIEAEQEQAQLLAALKQSNEQMRNLALRIQEVQESERKDIAIELHDRVGQNLTGLNLNLKIMQNLLGPDFMPEMNKRLEESLLIVEETTHKIRDVMADLNPPILEEYGLLAAIKWYSGDFTEHTGIITNVRGEKLEPRLAPGVERILFRLVQESLNNIAKHAQATKVMIGVKSEADAGYLVIKDNGVGFDVSRVKEPRAQPHWGFLSMQQRAESIGAQLVVDSAPGKGTQVYVKFRRNHHGD